MNILNNLRDGLPYPYTENDAEEFIRAMLSEDKDNTFAFAITLDDQVIGSIGVFRQENIHYRTAEMGYYIGEKYWGNGYMTEACKAVIEELFTDGYNTIYIIIGRWIIIQTKLFIQNIE